MRGRSIGQQFTQCNCRFSHRLPFAGSSICRPLLGVDRLGDTTGPERDRATVYICHNWCSHNLHFTLSRERQGLVAGLVLLGTPFLILHGASQYADVPLAFFFVATVVLLFLRGVAFREEFLNTGRYGGCVFGMDKERRNAFFGCCSLHPLVTNLTKGKKQCATETLALLIGAVPISVVIVIYKVCLAARNDLVAGQGIGSSVPRLMDLSRYHLVIHSFLSLPFYFGQWSPLTAMPVMLVFYFCY